MAAVAPGTAVWFDHPVERWVPATVAEAGSKSLSVTVDLDSLRGETREPTEGAPERHTMKAGKGAEEAGLVGAESGAHQPDMLVFRPPHAPALLHNLRLGFYQNLAFSSVGSVLVALCPDQASSLCGPRALWEHCRLCAACAPPQQPHIFALAREAHEALRATGKSQAIVLAGESGSGKTQLAKLGTQLLLEVGTLGSPTPRSPTVTAERHLHCARLLEAFGSTRCTAQNPGDATRFGCVTTIVFDARGRVAPGGKIQAFLLELERVANGGADGPFRRDERNFSVLYQLTTGAEPTLRQRHHIRSSADYVALLARSQFGRSGQLDDRDDCHGWMETAQSLTRTFSEKECGHILSILSGVLWMGNLGFAEGQPGSPMQLANGQEAGGSDATAEVARLLGVPEADLQRVLTESGAVPLSAPQCCARRDALAKHLYGRLFTWMCEAMNSKLSADADDDMSGGCSLVDLPGHELCETGTLRTLAFSFLQERLHAYCHRQLWIVEHALYTSEQLDVTEPSKEWDNQSVVDLLVGTRGNPSSGLLGVINQAVSNEGADDESVLRELHERFASKRNSHPAFARASPTTFVVKHFAGDVSYSTKCFVQSSTQLPADVTEAMARSTIPFIAALFAGEGDAQQQSREALEVSEDVFAQLSRMQNHFVRCIRPSSNEHEPFDSDYVATQLDVLRPLVALRQEGFPVALSQQLFVQRFRMLDNATTAEQILSKVAEPDEWQLGTTNRVFLKERLHARLLAARSNAFEKSAKVISSWLTSELASSMWRRQTTQPFVCLQALARGAAARLVFQQRRADAKCIAQLEAALAAASTRLTGGRRDSSDLAMVEAGMIAGSEIGAPSAELEALLEKAREVAAALRAHKRTERLLGEAVAPPTKISLLEALWEASNIGMSSATVERAQATYEQNFQTPSNEGQAKEAKSSLKQALEYNTKHAGERYEDRRRRLAVALELIRRMKVTGDSVDKLVEGAEGAIRECIAEMDCLANLATASEARRCALLADTIERGQNCSGALRQQLQEATELLTEIRQQEALEQALQTAIAKGAPSLLDAAMGAAEGVPVPPPSLEQARQRRAALLQEAGKFQSLFASFTGAGAPAKRKSQASPQDSIDVAAFVKERQASKGTSVARLSSAPMLRSAGRGPHATEGTDALVAAAALAVRQIILESDSDFLRAVALLKAAAASDKAGRQTEGALSYMAAAHYIHSVQSDPQEAAKKKQGLAKKMQAVDKRISSALKDSSSLFQELDVHSAGTIDEAAFGKLMEAMAMQALPGEFAEIDQDGSGAIEYAEFQRWSAATGRQQSADSFHAGWCAILGVEAAGLQLEEELRRLGLTVSADLMAKRDEPGEPVGIGAWGAGESAPMLEQPLTKLSGKAFCDEALQNWRCILGYTGDLPYAFSPFLCATELLERGRDLPELADEILLQLCSHAGGSVDTSRLRGWQLLQMALQTFDPSSGLQPWLDHFLYETILNETSSAVQKHAAEALKHRLSGASGTIPTRDNIEGMRAGEGARDFLIYTADGTTRVPIEDDSTVGDMATAAALARGARFASEYGLYYGDSLTSIASYTLFKTLSNPPSEDVGTSKRGRLKLKRGGRQGGSDVISQRWELRKRLVFLREVETASDADVHQLFLQCRQDVLAAKYSIADAAEALLLAVLAANVEHGTAALTADFVTEYLQRHVPSSLHSRWRAEAWLEDFEGVRTRMAGVSKGDSKRFYVRCCERYDAFGTEFYEASKKGRGMKEVPTRCLLGVSWAGLSVFGNEKRGAPRRLLIWSYNQLAGWGASADGKTLTVVALKHDTADDDGREKTREFSTEAGVSAAIATLLTDYVGAYRSQRAEMLAAREPEPEPDAASDV